MSVLDIIVIAILVVFLLIGLWKGFLRTLLSLFGNLASIVVAILLAKTVAKFLDGIFGIANKLTPIIAEFVTPVLPVFDTETEIVGSTVELTGANKILESLMRPFITDGTYASTANLATAIGEKLAALVTIVLTAILLFIVIKIVIKILSKIFDAITKASAISGLDRVLGAICGLLKGAVIVVTLLSIFYTLSSLPIISNWFDPLIEQSGITVKIYNFIQEAFAWLSNKVNLSGTLSNWIGNITA